MYLAKIQLLPTEYPTARMVLISVSTIDDTWVSVYLPIPIPCILESGFISNDNFTRVRGDAK